ncbi:MAG TPA: hypothetical protein VI172_16025 [Candidatus Dormibacteraeota bacterium]|jgi:hypothetical protein
MDPNATLRRIEDADTRREQREACEDLRTWLARGGFHPDWDAYPKATAFYRKHFGLGDDLRS